ncbi:MAG: hypothetical protein OEZ52_02720 [Candidatus Aminicenantes bacterium]|nr:hypothetical protein [Candidatus Aminicenantes bacterium]MDH5742436.1 hypothetical protein [Candidatus Aminicenantes bacterium]
MGIQGNPYAASDCDIFVINLERGLHHALLDILPKLPGLLLVHFRHDENKFITRITDGNSFLLDFLSNDFNEMRKSFVTHRMSVAVVDVFKIIYVEQEEGD